MVSKVRIVTSSRPRAECDGFCPDCGRGADHLVGTSPGTVAIWCDCPPPPKTRPPRRSRRTTSATTIPAPMLTDEEVNAEWWARLAGHGEPFCACGRRWSDCDGSRRGCNRKRLNESAPPDATLNPPAGAPRP
jgi:hypothetical protein